MLGGVYPQGLGGPTFEGASPWLSVALVAMGQQQLALDRGKGGQDQ